MKVQVVRAWPDRFEAVDLDLPEGATVDDALAAAGLARAGVAGLAIHGLRVRGDERLVDGDRVELLGALLADPKDTRRRRADAQARRGRR